MADNSFSPVDALAIGGGKVIAAGTLEQVKKALAPSGNSKMINLKGHCILPGFVEPHLHLLLSALTIKFFVNLQPSTTTSRECAIQKLTDAASKTKADRWVAAFGYDPS
ncbi:hypothetical protein FRB94_001794 [Tulasnella sp. JGI-2019a]|nr:hypothetical protein FRB93_003788 [Tulasnella sp. JGI-2019a]KAG9005177.1 hypothetical protein FRB94_001794 [Tulasnella sp. JGI-2019a]